MGTNYPAALDTTTNQPVASALTGVELDGDGNANKVHSTLHGVHSEAVVAIEGKIGTGASTPIANRVLRGTGTGTSAWSQVALATDVSGSLPVANTALVAGTGITLATNTLNVDAAQSQITTVGTIGTGVWQGTAVASGYIAADAITGAKIADDAIGSEHIADDAVVTAAIADDAITSALIADDAVVTAAIADNAITNALMADNAIDSAELAAGSIDTAHIADNQITLAKMAGGVDGNIISYDANGDPVAIATGNDGQVLTSAGANNPPAFEDAGGGGGKVVQVVNKFDASDITTTSSSYTDVFGADASITLSSSNNHVIALWTTGQMHQGNSGGAAVLTVYLDCRRTTTAYSQSAATLEEQRFSDTAFDFGFVFAGSHYDAGSNFGGVDQTYQVRWKRTGGNNATQMAGCSLILMEIEA